MWEEYRIPSSQLGERSNLSLLGSGEEPQKLCKRSYFDVDKSIVRSKEYKKTVSLEKLIYVLKDGWTPLMWASLGGHVTCVQLLVDRGAQINHQDEDRWTALMKASATGQVKCVKVLLDRGAEVNMQDKNGRTALMKASAAGRVECVKVLLDRGAEVNMQDKGGQTALMMAYYSGHIECAKMLVEKGAQVNIQGPTWGETALMKASEKGQVECVKVLLHGGVQVNVQNKILLHGVPYPMGVEGLICGLHHLAPSTVFGSTLNVLVNLHSTVVNIGEAHATGLSTPSGIMWDSTAPSPYGLISHDRDGYIPLTMASYGGHVTCVQLLVDRGAQINHQHKHGETPLMRASSGGHVTCVQLLVDRGAQINHQDKHTGGLDIHVGEHI
ncbi:hypothetical protein EMCRGX_G011629 [Ephydatia muelleri]